MSSIPHLVIERSKSACGINKVEARSTISQFSVEQNKKIASVMNSEHLFGMKTFVTTSDFSGITKKNQFSKLIEKIEKITDRSMIAYTETELKEDQYYDFKLCKDQRLNFSVLTLGKLCPLIVKIVKQGKQITYVSSVNKDPGPDSFEKVFTSDKFFVSETNFRFKSKKLFFTMISIDASDVRISIEFKKLHFTNINTTQAQTAREIERLQNDIMLKQQFSDRVEELIKKRKAILKERAGNKNFLRLNKISLTIDEKHQLIRTRSDQRIKKGQTIIEKKNNSYINKIEKLKSALQLKDFLKREIKFKHSKKPINQKKILSQEWIKLLVMVNATIFLRQKFSELKSYKIKIQLSASKIQRIYKRWSTHSFSNFSKETLHARNSFLLFRSIYHPFIKKFLHGMAQYVNEKINNDKPKYLFAKLISKLHSQLGSNSNIKINK